MEFMIRAKNAQELLETIQESCPKEYAINHLAIKLFVN